MTIEEVKKQRIAIKNIQEAIMYASQGGNYESVVHLFGIFPNFKLDYDIILRNCTYSMNLDLVKFVHKKAISESYKFMHVDSLLSIAFTYSNSEVCEFLSENFPIYVSELVISMMCREAIDVPKKLEILLKYKDRININEYPIVNLASKNRIRDLEYVHNLINKKKLIISEYSLNEITPFFIDYTYEVKVIILKIRNSVLWIQACISNMDNLF